MRIPFDRLVFVISENMEVLRLASGLSALFRRKYL
jgi:hypothetical protein